MFRFFLFLLVLIILGGCKSDQSDVSDTHSKEGEIHPVWNFVLENPDKASVLISRNDSIFVSHRSTQMMPLASTMKIVIAIEYANQAARGMIDADGLVDLKEVEAFYIPNTDGGAHVSWRESVKESIVEGQIPLRSIAKGMISHSSNANTEYIQELLGLDKINSRIKKLGITDHDPIYYLVSSLFLETEVFPNLSGKKLVEALQTLPNEEYIEQCNIIHQKLKRDPEYLKSLGPLNVQTQRVWSNRLPRSTTETYHRILKSLNEKTEFTKEVYFYLDECMETLMENPRNKEWLKHSGLKGGSTMFVLTEAMYATDKKGNRTEFVFFLEDLGYSEVKEMSRHLNSLELSLLNDPNFIKELSLPNL